LIVARHSSMRYSRKPYAERANYAGRVQPTYLLVKAIPIHFGSVLDRFILHTTASDDHLGVALHDAVHTEIRRPPHDDPEIKRHPEFAEHFYQRKIGNHWHTKLIVGKPGKRLKRV
jgi:hypothetical protein